MKYLIICEKRGVFLGTYLRLGFFSLLDNFGSYKAPAFDSIKDAIDYAEEFMNIDKTQKFMYPSFSTKEKHISIIDIARSGYGQYAGDMMSNLPNYSETMH